MTIVTVDNLSFRYNSAEVLAGISFDVHEGDFIGLVGPNGSGKTTVIKVILGLLKQINGQIWLFGTKVNAFRDWHRIGYLPQKLAHFNPHFPATVKEIVSSGVFSAKKFPKRIHRSDEALIDEAMVVTDVADIRHKMIGELSGGQQQRVFLARALMQDASIYMMDEPFQGVDASTERAIIALLKDLRSAGKTVICVHHDLQTVQEYFDWVTLLNIRLIAGGPVVSVFTPENLKKTYGGRIGFLKDSREDHS